MRRAVGRVDRDLEQHPAARRRGDRTEERRDGIACYYCAGWIRQQENQQLGLPMERLRSFDRRLQELCGFSVYRGIYGHIDNHDPIELLGRDSDRLMVWEASDRRRSE